MKQIPRFRYTFKWMGTQHLFTTTHFHVSKTVEVFGKVLQTVFSETLSAKNVFAVLVLLQSVVRVANFVQNVGILI